MELKIIRPQIRTPDTRNYIFLDQDTALTILFIARLHLYSINGGHERCVSQSQGGSTCVILSTLLLVDSNLHRDHFVKVSWKFSLTGAVKDDSQ